MSTENYLTDETSGVPPPEPRRDEFSRILLALAKDFINIPLHNMHGSFDEAMALIAGYCDADRIVGYHYDWVNNLAHQHYEWNRVPESGTGGMVETLALSDFETALACHRRGHAYVVNNIDELPDNSTHKFAARSVNAGSLCSFPVIFQGELRGTIALSTVGRQKNWTAAEIDAIQIFCDIVSTVMLRLDEETKFQADRNIFEKESLKNTVLEKEKELLNAKERELLEILDGTTDGAYILDLKAGTFKNTEKLLTQTGCEKIPKAELLGYFRTLIHPEDRERVIQAREAAARLRKSKHEDEFRIKTPDGRYIWVQVRGKLIYNEDGEPVRYYGTTTDITDRKESEAALRESERRALALVGELERTKEDLTEEIEALRRLHLISSEYLMLSDLVFIYDEILEAAIDLTHADKGYMQIYVEQENCLKIINQRGFSEPYLKCFAVVTPGRLTSGLALNNRERVIDPGKEAFHVYSDEELRLIRDEEVRSVQSTPIISSTGVIYGILNTHYKTRHDFSKRELRILDLLARMAADFIERKRSEVALAVSEKNAMALVSALQKADRNKNEFLNQLSHELRNPLATINAAITLIDVSDDLGQIRETNAIIKSETKQLNRLIDDLLDVTRITTNKIKIKKKLMNLSDMVLNSANNFRPQFHQKKVSFEARADDAPIYLHADPARIMQIIENLLMNALTYTDEGGAVTLTLKHVGENAVIRVEDNGIGIQPEELPMLFNAFYQAQKTRNRPESGLGLGLAIVKGMAELHGGRVSAYSKGIGYGSLFTVSLPLDTASSAAAQNT